MRHLEDFNKDSKPNDVYDFISDLSYAWDLYGVPKVGRELKVPKIFKLILSNDTRYVPDNKRKLNMLDDKGWDGLMIMGIKLTFGE